VQSPLGVVPLAVLQPLLAPDSGGKSLLAYMLTNEQDHHDSLQRLYDDVQAARAGETAGVPVEAQTEADIRELEAALDLSKFVQRCHRAISASVRHEAALRGRDEVLGLETYEHEGQRHVLCQIKRRVPVFMSGWSNKDGERQPAVPTVFLDGSGTDETYEALLNWLPVEAKHHEAKPSHYTLTQYADRPYGASVFSGKGKDKVTGEDSRSNIRRLQAFLCLKSARHGTAPDRGARSPKDGRRVDVLVVSQKDVVDRLTELGVPRNVELLWFNNLRGLDWAKDVPCGVFVGQPWPQWRELERAAAALHYDDPSVLRVQRLPEDAWPTTKVSLFDTSGNHIEFEAPRHPDPTVERRRFETVEAEVLQAVARLRLFDRGPDTAAEIHVFGQTNLTIGGLKVGEFRRWQDANVQPLEVMTAAGVIFGSAGPVEAAWPGLVAKGARQSRDVVKAAFQEATQVLQGSSDANVGLPE
jgi:hypothetical protein